MQQLFVDYKATSRLCNSLVISRHVSVYMGSVHDHVLTTVWVRVPGCLKLQMTA